MAFISQQKSIFNLRKTPWTAIILAQQTNKQLFKEQASTGAEHLLEHLHS